MKAATASPGSHRVAFAGFAAFGSFFHDAGYFDSRHKRRLGRAGINSHALQQVGEINAYGFHADQHFAGLGVRVRHFLRFKNFRRTVPLYNHRAHLKLLPGGCGFPDDDSINAHFSMLRIVARRNAHRLTHAQVFTLDSKASYLKLLDSAQR